MSPGEDAVSEATTVQVSVAPPRRDWRGLLLRLAVAAVVVACCVFLARRLHFDELRGAFTRAHPGRVALAVLFILLGMAAQAVRLQVLLRPSQVVPVHRVGWYLFVSNAASNLLPARAGEVLRVYLLRQREGVPSATTVAALVLERLLETVALVLLLLPAPLLLPGLPPKVLHGLLLAVAALALGLLMGGWLLRLSGRGLPQSLPGRALLERLRNGALALQRPRLLLAAFAAALAAWLLEGLSIAAVLSALDLRAPLYTPVVVLLAINAAILLPSTPAQIGAFELGAVAGLRLAGVSGEGAVAAAVLCHAVQFFPVTLVGLPGLPGALNRGQRTPS